MPYKDKNKQREYQVQRMKEARLSWISQYGKCASCGSSANLEVDHIDPSKKVSHRIWSWSEKRRQEELSKCQVLCRSCNIAKRWEGKRAKHGTASKYFKGCRCRPCKDARAEYSRNRRAAGATW